MTQALRKPFIELCPCLWAISFCMVATAAAENDGNHGFTFDSLLIFLITFLSVIQLPGRTTQ